MCWSRAPPYSRAASPIAIAATSRRSAMRPRWHAARRLDAPFQRLDLASIFRTIKPCGGPRCPDVGLEIVSLGYQENHRMRARLLVCVAFIVLPFGHASAQPNTIDSIRTPQTSSLTEYWTDNQRQIATAMPVPVLDPSTLQPVPAEPRGGTPHSGR